MKFFYTFLLSVFTLFTLSLSAMAQEQAKEKATQKIAFVDPLLFYDEKDGILVLINANKNLNYEIKPRQEELDTISKKIELLKKEIASCDGCLSLNIEAKQRELERLTDEGYKKLDAAKALYEKRRTELFKPIEDDVYKELKDFTIQKGIKVLFNLRDGGCYVYSIDFDITKELIAYYNAKHAVTNSQTQVKLSEPR